MQLFGIVGGQLPPPWLRAWVERVYFGHVLKLLALLPFNANFTKTQFRHKVLYCPRSNGDNIQLCYQGFMQPLELVPRNNHNKKCKIILLLTDGKVGVMILIATVVIQLISSPLHHTFSWERTILRSSTRERNVGPVGLAANGNWSSD